MQSRYGAPPPEMAAAFSSAATRIPGGVPEEASPISSRPAPLQLAVSRPPVSFFEEFGIDVGAVGGSFPDEEALGAGEESERAGSAGNRWPRQETMALLKIRSEMDAAFRDATLKGPLWDDVSRKLGELGYARSAKKCKEKFENVHKYYKRTKEGRAGRQDGKSYRFFSQLEAIQSTGGVSTAGALLSPFPFAPNTSSFPTIASVLAPGAVSPPPVNTSPSFVLPGSTMKTESSSRIQPPVPAVSSNTSSPSASDTDGDETEEGVAGAEGLQESGRKRKREGWPVGSRKMMSLFDRLMKQVMERQELMQKKFFETIEKREQDRMIREEAWKRQEMARLNREYELMAQERAVAANRDAAIISFLEKLSRSSANQPPPTPPETSPAPQPQCSPTHQHKSALPELESERSDFALNQLSVSSEPGSIAAAMSDMAGGSLDGVSPTSSSRWPKPEVLALIRIRSGLETRYLEAGPKGPLWEEISLEMKRLGYGRNAKRCKEKWENINKYFKKVKESNKKRPEDAKTCPYFHELDSLYRKKQLTGGGAAIAVIAVANTNPQPIREPLRTLSPISRPTEQENDNGQKKQTFLKSNMAADGGNREIAGDQIQRTNGAGIPQIFFGGVPNRGGGAVLKKPEDIIRELMEQQNQNDCDKLGHPADSDTINHEYDDEDEDYDDDEEENNNDGKLQFEIQFQRQAVGAATGGPRTPNATAKVAASASSTGSFLAMVQ